MNETDVETDVETSTARPPRVVVASRWRSGVLYGDIEICGSTKHGNTTMIAVMPPEELNAGETLVTKAWVLGVRNFVVIGHHGKPMKLPGTWYEVRAVKQVGKPAGRPAPRQMR